MNVFLGIFFGYLLGVCVTMLCVHLAGGQLYGKENAPDDDRASEPEQAQMDSGAVFEFSIRKSAVGKADLETRRVSNLASIAQKMHAGKEERSAKWKR